MNRSGARLLIAEESLRGHGGHEFSYARSVAAFNRAEGVEVAVAVHAGVDPSLEWEETTVHPLFTASYWHGDYPASELHLPYRKARQRRRALRVILRANRRFYRELAAHLAASERYDLVFAPMVILHQLLAWLLLLVRFRSRIGCAVLLFRFNAAGSYGEAGEPEFGWIARVLGRCLRLFRPLVRRGRVRFVCDSEALAREYRLLSELPFTVLPSPQLGAPRERTIVPTGGRALVFTSPGLAQYIKGIDVLLDAARLLRADPAPAPVRFVIQWPAPAVAEGREPLEPDERLAADGSVEYVRRTLSKAEYDELLLGSDCIVLPYRIEGYRARTSGVIVEAATAGIPMIVAAGTTLEEGLRSYGAGRVAAEGDAADLAAKIREIAASPEKWAALARDRAATARASHSPARFQELLWGG